jgi:hypothetical protein
MYIYRPSPKLWIGRSIVKFEVYGCRLVNNRLLVYNEDDCKANMVLKQALEKLPVKNKR